MFSILMCSFTQSIISKLLFLSSSSSSKSKLMYIMLESTYVVMAAMPIPNLTYYQHNFYAKFNVLYHCSEIGEEVQKGRGWGLKSARAFHIVHKISFLTNYLITIIWKIAVNFKGVIQGQTQACSVQGYGGPLLATASVFLCFVCLPILRTWNYTLTSQPREECGISDVGAKIEVISRPRSLLQGTRIPPLPHKGRR